MAGSKNQHRLSANELNHRLQNSRTVMESVVSFGLVGDGMIEKAVIKQRLIDQINATSDATRTARESKNGSVRLIDISARKIRRLEPQLNLVGANGRVPTPQVSQNLSVTLNELKANARRHGSLSVPEGPIQ